MSDLNKQDYYDELQRGVDMLTSIICKYKNKNNIEIEIRLGQIQFNEFKSGLGSNDFFNKIRDILDSSKCWDKVINNKYEEICFDVLRRTTVFNGKKIIKHQCIKKHKLCHCDFEYTSTPYDIRMSVSQEIPTEDKIKSGVGILRKKNRFSYYYKDYRIDLTHVEQIDNGVSTINYELEVEFINLNNNILDNYRAHSGLLFIRDIINMCEEIQSGSKLILSDKNLSKGFNNMEIN